MSPGLTERPLGRFSVAPTTATIRTGSPIRAIAATRRDHRRAAGHVELHLRHLRPGLQRDAAAVERHGLAHEAEQRAGCARRLVAQRDQRRLLLGALRHRRERAHRARQDALASLDLHRQVLDLLAELARMVGQGGRGQVVGRPVLQVARFVDGLAPRSAPRRQRLARSPSPATIKSSRCLGLASSRLRSSLAVRCLAQTCGCRSCSRPAPSPARAPPRPSPFADAVRRLPAQRLGRYLPGALARHGRRDARPLGREVLACRPAHDQPALAVRVGQRKRLDGARAPRRLPAARPPAPGAPAGASSPSNTPIATVSASVCSGLLGCP